MQLGSNDTGFLRHLVLLCPELRDLNFRRKVGHTGHSQSVSLRPETCCFFASSLTVPLIRVVVFLNFCWALAFVNLKKALFSSLSFLSVFSLQKFCLHICPSGCVCLYVCLTSVPLSLSRQCIEVLVVVVIVDYPPS